MSIMMTLFDEEYARKMELENERREALEEAARNTAKAMYTDGMTVEQIAKYIGYSAEEISRWVKAAG